MIMTQNGKPNKSPVLASSLSDGPNLGRRKFSGPASTQHPLKVYFPIMLFISHHQHLHKGRMTRLWIFSISVTWKEPPVPRFCLIFFHVLCWDTRLTDKVCNVVTHVHDLLLQMTMITTMTMTMTIPTRSFRLSMKSALGPWSSRSNKTSGSNEFRRAFRQNMIESDFCRLKFDHCLSLSLTD